MNKENDYIFTYKECQLFEYKYKLDFKYYVSNKLRSECDDCKNITDNDVFVLVFLCDIWIISFCSFFLPFGNV
ncbi:MAG: hypothetical protein H9Q67_07130 [Spiroplasma ixodetis]|nr:hypothetical protein [Spiroplasma ixodetis]